MTAPSFELLGSWPPRSPVVVSVPHAGRDYPPALIRALRVPIAALVPLEDRHVDAVACAACRDETLLIQRKPRAWIDLNRSEDERDPQVDAGALDTQHSSSAKLRSGLGLVPRQVVGAGALWRRRFDAAQIDARIVADHRPYHAALATALAAARARFGVAVLLDLHSMPALEGPGPARFVIGDRFGRTAAGRFVAGIETAVAAGGYRAALNTPYAGAHILDRHGDPERDVHAIQLEIDRSLYLDRALRSPGSGLPAMAAIVRAAIDALTEEALRTGMPVAAE